MRKICIPPAYPIFAILKWIIRGYSLHGHVFLVLWRVKNERYIILQWLGLKLSAAATCKGDGKPHLSLMLN